MYENNEKITRKLKAGYAAVGLGSAVNDVSNAPAVGRHFGRSSESRVYVSMGVVKNYEARMG